MSATTKAQSFAGIQTMPLLATQVAALMAGPALEILLRTVSTLELFLTAQLTRFPAVTIMAGPTPDQSR